MVRFRRIVVDVDMHTVTEGNHALSRSRMLEISRQISLLHEVGIEIIIVTSGTVVAGQEVIKKNPIECTVPVKQMLSAIGQVRLMHLWSDFFAKYDITVGQVLLTRDDCMNHAHYLNIRSTLLSLLSHHLLPIVNENDTITTHLKMGNNEHLAALIANLVAADLLILLAQEEISSADPSKPPYATSVSSVNPMDTMTPLTKSIMIKLEAARFAAENGTQTVIASCRGMGYPLAHLQERNDRDVIAYTYFSLRKSKTVVTFGTQSRISLN